MTPPETPPPPRASLAELTALFLRLGLTSFGGPAAHIALMEAEVVRRRRWLTAERFLDLLGAANLIPGPSSTELAIFIGYDQAGWRGLILGGSCFILPAAVLVTGLAWAYVRFGALPHVGWALYGIKPVLLAIVAQALVGLAPKAIRRSRLLAAIGVLACAATALGVDAVAVLLASAALSVAAQRGLRPGSQTLLFAPGAALASGATAATSVTLGGLLLAFVKVGAVVFGSGYVLLAFLREDLVERLHWLSEGQLLDAVAVGQLTPGPVFTTATFIGYLIAGLPGAVVATVGIFLPGFLLVAAVRPVVDRLRRSPLAGALLDGVNVGALALMAVVAVQLGRASLVDAPAALLSAVGLLLALRWKVGSTWLVVGGALAGVARHLLPG